MPDLLLFSSWSCTPPPTRCRRWCPLGRWVSWPSHPGSH